MRRLMRARAYLVQVIRVSEVTMELRISDVPEYHSTGHHKTDC